MIPHVRNLKPVVFRGSALADLRAFPAPVRRAAGHQIDQVQRGRDPDDWRPMSMIGPGVREIRLRDAAGAFRVIYTTTFSMPPRAALLSEEDAEDQEGRHRPGDAAVSGPGKGAGTMSDERFSSVWDAIEATPAEAANLRLRSALMIALKEHIERQGWTQGEAAHRFGVTQPRVSDLMRGKIDRFGLDTLVNMAVTAGLRVELRIAEVA
jgi:predicted XRE-type DNA-binding protein